MQSIGKRTLPLKRACSIGNSGPSPIFRCVAEIQRCFVSSPRVCSGQHVHNTWQRYWQHIAGTTWRPTGPNAPSFATTSCVAHALLACPGFLVSDLYVRHATSTWCRYRPRRETYGTRGAKPKQLRPGSERIGGNFHSMVQPCLKANGWGTPRIFLVLQQRVPCHLFRRRFIFGDNCDQSSALACTMLQRVH